MRQFSGTDARKSFVMIRNYMNMRSSWVEKFGSEDYSSLLKKIKAKAPTGHSYDKTTV